MPRRIRLATPQDKPAEPEKSPEKSTDEAVFRSPHPGLKVLVEQAKQKDLGGGAYTITPPKLVEFENHGNYGEAQVGPTEAAELRAKAKRREKEGLPPKYVEV